MKRPFLLLIISLTYLNQRFIGQNRLGQQIFLLQSTFLTPLLMLGLFMLLSIIVTYPLFLHLADFSIYHLYSDDLLEAWTLKWDIHSLLSGSTGLQNFWNANIFYPYPNTLAYSEHLLSTALALLPFILLIDRPLGAANLGVLLTTALSGWGTYLLVTWLTGNRWAGVVAGIAFALAPFRLSHLTQLHLLSTHWLPFIFLITARLIKFNRPVDLILLILFTNLQFFASINYAPLIALALAVWGLACLYSYRARLSYALLVHLLIFAAVTFLLNWPVLKRYQQVSEHLEVVRTLGDAKVYGASVMNYLLPLQNSLLYGRWLGLPTHLDYLGTTGTGALVSTFFGVSVLLLALAGSILLFRQARWNSIRSLGLSLVMISLIGFSLSFGANDEALGKGFSAITVHLLPYPYLYEGLSLLQGLRVPIRFALLPTFGVAILAGLGFAALTSGLKQKQSFIVTIFLSSFILLEHLPAPLPGAMVPYGSEGYHWLATNLPPDSAVVLELPYYLHTSQGVEELLREYQATAHWQRLVNGGSGFKPEELIRLGAILDTFPDWRSFDLLQQLGVNYVVLHQDKYTPEAWANLTALLPLYLPAIEALHTTGNDLILALAVPDCRVQAGQVQVDGSHFPLISFSNSGSSSWVGDPQKVSWVEHGSNRAEFLEPLFLLPGQTLKRTLPLTLEAAQWQVTLGNLGEILTSQKPTTAPQTKYASPEAWQPLQIPFINGVVLQAMAISDSPSGCGKLALGLQWQFPTYTGEKVRIELVDQFDRLTSSSELTPSEESDPRLTLHELPLAETIPAGAYQLRVRLLTAAGDEIPALGANGAPVAQPLSLPLTLRPPVAPFQARETVGFANGLIWLGVEGLSSQATPGDWLRFTLYWQSEAVPDSDYTVFTQLLGPDGQVWGQHDNQPKGGWYATSLWQPGEIVADDYAVRLDSTAPSGAYRMIVGMYNPATGERVKITEGPEAGQDFKEAASISVLNLNIP
jgi:hypothetical protein